MSFMEAQMTYKTRWYSIETDCGTWFVETCDVNCTEAEAVAALDAEDADTVKELVQYTEGTEIVEPITVIVGYGVRASAPGYTDCTDWDVYTNKREAIKAYNELCRELEGEDE